MSTGFQVDCDVLAEHAYQVDDMARRMRRAADAGQPLGLDCYGIIGQIFAVAATDATRLSSEAVAGFSDLSQRFGDGVRDCGEAYGREDAGIASTMTGLNR